MVDDRGSSPIQENIVQTKFQQRLVSDTLFKNSLSPGKRLKEPMAGVLCWLLLL